MGEEQFNTLFVNNKYGKCIAVIALMAFCCTGFCFGCFCCCCCCCNFCCGHYAPKTSAYENNHEFNNDNEVL